MDKSVEAVAVSTHELQVCLTLKAIHTLDSGAHVELKFVAQPCGEVRSGDMTLRVTPEEGGKYMLGDTLFIHTRVS